MAWTDKVAKNWALLATVVLCLVCVAIFRARLNWDPLVMGVKVTDVASLLAPLAFCAAVIERAIEIIISPWRDTGATQLQNTITAIQARTADPATAAQNALDLKNATDALNAYRGETQKLAFLVSVLLSFMVAMAGIRAIGPFLDSTKFDALRVNGAAQRLFFLTVDVVLSAALLAGGADGIHAIVTSITDFLNNKSGKTNT
jgi:hypothetical protein